MICSCGRPLAEPPRTYMLCGGCGRFYCKTTLVLDTTRNTMGAK